LTAIVSGVSVQEFKGETVLQIIGTSEVDHISVNQTGNGLIRVHWDFLGDDPREIPAAGVDRILAILCEGDDHLNISGRITLPTIIDAGAGNDHVNGGGGSDIILGGPDDDHLHGGEGRDILIGGDGIDRIVGGPGQDIMTGDRIQDSSAPNEELLENCDALLAAQDRWLDDDPIEDRVDDLDDFFASMFDDLNSDKLTGSSSEDHVVLFRGDTWTDEKSNGKGKKR
jgi:Ca2+-binding RTX toxin-like protein